MLRLLSIPFAIAIYSSTLLAQQTPSNSMPTEKDISEQRAMAQDILNNADALLQSEELPQSLADEQELMRQIKNDGLRGFLNGITENPDLRGMPDFLNAALEAGQSEAFSTSSTDYDPMNPIILVSFSMPESELQALLDSAHRLGAAVYLRGFLDNDVNKTIDKLIELAADGEYALSIDPTLFRRFNVQSVPTFILPLEPLMPCDDSGCADVEHVQASGSVSLEYFLELVERTGTEVEKRAAGNWLESDNEG